jgi:hypothetical protein
MARRAAHEVKRGYVVPLVLVLATIVVSVCAATILPGGGSPTSDCYTVLPVEGTKAATVPNRLECQDGDPTCDQDGRCDGKCTFRVQICWNQSGITGCIPPNALKKCTASARNVRFPVSSCSGCQAPTDVDVVGKVQHNGAKRTAKLRIRLLAVAATGRPKRDLDNDHLVCLPRPDAEPCPTTSTTATTPPPTTTSTTATPATSTTTTTCPQAGCMGATTILMQPDLPDGFFSMPWPNDTRVKGDGTIDLDGYPGSDSNGLLALVLSRGSAKTKAFGTHAAIFMRTSAAVDPTSLPTPEESVGAASPVLLVNLDDPGEPPMPFLVDAKVAATTYRPQNLLTVLPYPGHPLKERTRHAVIVLNGVRDAAGLPLAPAPLLAELEDAWDVSKPVGPAQWTALQAQRDDVLAYVDHFTAWKSDQVVAFSVFTTQDVTGEMDAIKAAIASLPTPTPVSRTAGVCASAGATRASVSGFLDLPRWQAGPYPYTDSGGDIVVSDGKAVQQGTQRAAFEMTFPCGSAPAGGWPILLWMDGTGAFANSEFIPELGGGILPYLVASVAPLYGGDRAVPGAVPELLFFNYLNPVAGRTNQLQQAADMLYLRRIVDGVVLSAAETGTGGPVDSNDDVVVIIGHSQGALTVPHVLAVDPAFDGGFISAGGGGLYQTIVHRGDIRSLIDGLLGTQPGELDMFHPVVHALQTLAEVGDAANYAKRVDHAHVVSVGGTKDGCSPLEVVQVLGTALGLDVGNPLVHPMFGSARFEPNITAFPVHGNLADGRTGVTIQLDTGHFGASTNPQIGRTFVESLAAGGVPTVAPGPLSADFNAGCAGRFDPLPTASFP